MTIRVLTLACTMAVGVAAAAEATTISITTFDLDLFENAQGAMATRTIENFEDLSATGAELNENNGSGGFDTAVGTFAPTGLAGQGQTPDIPLLPSLTDNNDDSLLALRKRSIFSRSNTTRDGTWYLDSNDVSAMTWDVGLSGNRYFNTVLFTLTDATDQGARLQIFADGGSSATEEIVGNSNGNAQVVFIKFGTAITGATIVLGNISGNLTKDGFGIDDATVGMSPIPLPAAGWMLLAAIGALGIARRHKTVA